MPIPTITQNFRIDVERNCPQFSHLSIQCQTPGEGIIITKLDIERGSIAQERNILKSHDMHALLPDGLQYEINLL